MGREIRRVPPGWQHPKQTKTRYVPGEGLQWVEEYRPLFDRSYVEVAREWQAGCALWAKGEHPDQKGSGAEYEFYWDWSGHAPDKEYYVDYDVNAPADDWLFAVYETVSEGTPVTPAFATKQELIDYLATSGDFWDRKRGEGPWSRENAEKFVNAGWAPSFVVNTSDGVLRAARDGQS